MSAFTGIGTVLKRGTAAIAGIISISGPGMSRDTIDSTTLDNVDGYREFISGLRDGGTLTFELLFDKTGYQALKTDFENDSPETYSIELPDADTTIITFGGLVTDFPVNIPLDDKVTVSVTIKISGGITIT